jgi:hypothetical protein
MATATATAPVIDQNIERTKQEYREGLATSVKTAFAKFAAHKGAVEALWAEFALLQGGETIHGCHTKTEFCEKVLGRSIRAVQYMLDGGNHKRTAEPTRETISRPKEAHPVKPAEIPAVENVRSGVQSPIIEPVGALTRLQELAGDRYLVTQTKSHFTLQDTEVKDFTMRFPTEGSVRHYLTEVELPVVDNIEAPTDKKFTIDGSNPYLRCLNIPVNERTADECAHRSIETLNNLFSRLSYLESKTPVTRCQCENSHHHHAYDLTLRDLSDDQVYTIYRILAGELPLSSVRHREDEGGV